MSPGDVSTGWKSAIFARTEIDLVLGAAATTESAEVALLRILDRLESIPPDRISFNWDGALLDVAPVEDARLLGPSVLRTVTRLWQARTVELRGQPSRAEELYESIASDDATPRMRGLIGYLLASLAFDRGDARLAVTRIDLARASMPMSERFSLLHRLACSVVTLGVGAAAFPGVEAGTGTRPLLNPSRLAELLRSWTALTSGSPGDAARLLSDLPVLEIERDDSPWGDWLGLRTALFESYLWLRLEEPARALSLLELHATRAEKPSCAFLRPLCNLLHGRVGLALSHADARSRLEMAYEGAWEQGRIHVIASAARAIARTAVRGLGTPQNHSDALRFLNEALNFEFAARNHGGYLRTLALKAHVYESLGDVARAVQIVAEGHRYCDRHASRIDFDRMLRKQRPLDLPTVEVTRRRQLSGRSPAFLRTVALLDRAEASRGLDVLMLAETGTGKRLAAEYIHFGANDRESDRPRGPLVVVNCAALPDALVESELFGTIRGAATGTIDRPGKFELANGGTLFLDEIGELSLAAQAKILTALEERRFHRLGAQKATEVDFRVIAATHRDLLLQVKEGRFREDLWYRLGAFVVKIPPLRDRSEDIVDLALSTLRDLARQDVGVTVRAILPKAMDWLVTQRWPGNIRQLQHFVRSVAILNAEVPTLSLEMFEDAARDAGGSMAWADPPEGRLADSQAAMADVELAQFRRSGADTDSRSEPSSLSVERVLATVAGVEGNLSAAARALGIPIRTLHHRIERWGLQQRVAELREQRRAPPSGKFKI